MFRKAFGKTDLPLSEYEIQLRRRRQRKLVLIGAAILVLLLIGYLSARPVLNIVRGWQARRHAQKAFAFIDHEQWTDARNEAVAGYQLRPNEPQAIRAVARLLSRAGQTDALKFWQELEAESTLTRSDLRDQAGVALKTRELDIADHAIKKLLSDYDGGPTPGDWLLAADLAIQKQDLDASTSDLRRVFASTRASDREQLDATFLLERILRTREVPDQTEILNHLNSLSRGKESTSLDALVALAQHVLAAKEAWNDTAGVSVDSLIQGLETHPLAKPQHKLLAVDLKVHEHPDQRDALTQSAIDQWKGGDTTALLALATWLNSHGEYQRELDTISRQRAMQTRELFFQHVDALGALGRWDEIRRLIESEQFPLDPVVEHMYLARCFAQQNQAGGAENNWRRALEAAAGDVSKLMTLGDYAEKNGVYDVAAAAYEAAVAVVPKSHVAQQARLRVAYATRDTKKIRAILADLLKMWPNDPAVQNDEAYVHLLLLPSDLSAGAVAKVESSTTAELASIEALAEKLVEHEPASLPHRTLLALALLKQSRPDDALSVYQDINVPANALTTSSLAVHAAVLSANGHLEEARTEFSKLPVDKLLPEERLMDPDNKK